MEYGPLNGLALLVHTTATTHGFWEEDRNFGEMLALIHSEVSEALEEHRDGKPPVYTNGHRKVCPARPRKTLFWTHSPGECDGLCKPEGTAVELVDALIRILDTLWDLDVDIDEVVASKMLYNASRPFKHGKAY